MGGGVRVPFEKVEVNRLLDEKLRNPGFENAYHEIMKTYELVRILVDARKCMGFTQRELAVKSRVKYHEIVRMENEKRLPTFSKLIRITEILNLEIKVEPKVYN